MLKKEALLTLVLLSFLLIGINQASASVTINGQVTFGTSTVNIVANSSAITANSISIDPTKGITTGYLSTDPTYTYNFARSGSSNIYTVQWQSLNSSEADFKVLTHSLTDVTGTTLGSALYQLFVDTQLTANNFLNNVNSFTVGSGTSIREILNGNAPQPSPGGGGGGGGGTPGQNIVTNQLVTNQPSATAQGITFSTNQDILAINQVKNETISITWPSNGTLTVNKITFGQSPLTIQQNLTPPYSFAGNPSGVSRAILGFTVQVPHAFCTDTVTANCIDPSSSSIQIPISFDVMLNGVEVTQTITAQYNIIGSQVFSTLAVLTIVGFTGGGTVLYAKVLKGKKKVEKTLKIKKQKHEKSHYLKKEKKTK